MSWMNAQRTQPYGQFNFWSINKWLRFIYLAENYLFWIWNIFGVFVSFSSKKPLFALWLLAGIICLEFVANIFLFKFL